MEEDASRCKRWGSVYLPRYHYSVRMKTKYSSWVMRPPLMIAFYPPCRRRSTGSVEIDNSRGRYLYNMCIGQLSTSSCHVLQTKLERFQIMTSIRLLMCTRYASELGRLSINAWSRRRRTCSDSSRLLLLSTTTSTSHHHVAHHIKQWVALAGHLDCKVHFSNLRQCLVPVLDIG